MYKLIRQIHLATGLSLLIFVVMYFVTGYVLIHGDWFGNPPPPRTTRTAPVAYTGEDTGDAWSRYLQNKFGLYGQRQPAQRLNDGQWRYRYVRPGVAYIADVSADWQSVRITEEATS